jgi:preprotein translocase subunit SecG
MLLGLLLVLQIIVCIALVGVILLQRSEGGALGMGGGGGGFMTARGAGDLLTRTTAILAAVFFALSMLLTIVAGQAKGGASVVDRLKVDALNPDALRPAQQPAAPAQPQTPVGAPAQGAPLQPQAPSVFEAPKPQVNTVPNVAPGVPPTSTADTGRGNPASTTLGVQTAPQAPQPAPKQ